MQLKLNELDASAADVANKTKILEKSLSDSTLPNILYSASILEIDFLSVD
jgi:hypothetical protein